MNLTYEEIPSESYAIKKALRAYIALRRKRNLSLMRPAAGGVSRKRDTFYIPAFKQGILSILQFNTGGNDYGNYKRTGLTGHRP